MIVRYGGFGLTYEQMMANVRAARESGVRFTPVAVAPKTIPEKLTMVPPPPEDHGIDPYSRTGSSSGALVEEGMSMGVKALIGAGLAVAILGGAYVYSRKR